MNDTTKYGHKGGSFNVSTTWADRGNMDLRSQMSAALNSPNFLDHCALYESPECHAVKLPSGNQNVPGLRHSIKYYLGGGMMDWEEGWNWAGFQCWELPKEQRLNDTAVASGTG